MKRHPPLTIRSAKLSDCPASQRLGGTPELRIADGRKLPLWYYREFIRTKQPFFVAIMDQKVVGFIIAEWITGHGLLAQYFVVHPRLRGQGIGNLLMYRLSLYAHQRKALFILTYVHAASPLNTILKRSKLPGVSIGALTREVSIQLRKRPARK